MAPLQLETDEKVLEALFSEEAFVDDYKILNREIRALGYTIPPLVNAYMGLSPTMRMFGTAVNTDFGNVEETGILIAVDEIIEEKRLRYIESFAKENPWSIELKTGAHKVFYPEGKAQS